MGKLTPRQVVWIVNQLDKGKSVYYIAKRRKISRRWVRQIRTLYAKRGEAPVFKKRGRKQMPVSAEDKELIVETWNEKPLNAVLLQKYLMIKMKKYISHNKIHSVLKEAGKSRNEPKKQKKRKWVRYERRHSNSLWHVDWSEMEDGSQLIIYEDDASRFIPAYGLFEEATLENALDVFLKALRHGKPKQLLSDNGSQFRFNERFDAPLDVKNRFQKKLKKLGVKQIFTRPNHPQCNGKLEKVNDTIKKLTRHFGSLDNAMKFYNYERPHMSLNMDILETPYMAFKRKMRKNR